MLGLPEDDRPQFIDWYTRLMAFVTNYAADPEVNARGVQAKQELTDYLLPLIAERRTKPARISSRRSSSQRSTATG